MIPTLTSERLYYKPLSLFHLHDYYVNWMNDLEVIKYLESGGNYTLELLEEYLKGIEEKPEILFWAIHLKENDKHIGNIKIDPINKRHGLGEYGIMMGDKTEWGKGYAKEASLRILKFCFEEIKLRKITLGVVAENIGAVELYKKIGFKTEGCLKNHGYYYNHYCDGLIMSLFDPNIKT